MRPRAIVRAGGRLFLAGMTSALDERDPFAAYEGRKGGLLWAMAAQDGKKLAEHPLASPPVWDGLAVARGRLFLSTMSGKVICMGGGQ